MVIARKGHRTRLTGRLTFLLIVILRNLRTLKLILWIQVAMQAAVLQAMVAVLRIAALVAPIPTAIRITTIQIQARRQPHRMLQALITRAKTPRTAQNAASWKNSNKPLRAKRSGLLRAQ